MRGCRRSGGPDGPLEDIRNLAPDRLDDPETLAALKALPRQQNTSVNATARRLIEQELGQAKPVRRRYDDLDDLAGAWSHEDADEFEALTADSRRIEPDLWK